jgi:putative membrane protein
VVIHLLYPGLPAVWLLWLQFGAAGAAWLLSGLPPVLRRLIPRRRAQVSVERSAELAFLEQGVFATRARTGVLILLSELEHRVAILGDEGIHARVQARGWEDLVARLAASIRKHAPGDGLCEVVREIGRFLAADVPAGPDNPDELDNRIRHQGSDPDPRK